MEAETVPSLSPLIIGADQWHEFLLLLPLLVALEAILSADNAIALAAISRRLHNPLKQRQALNFGLLLALVLRLLLIVAARWVLDFWPLQLGASLYLLWLSGKQLLLSWSQARANASTADQPGAPPDGTGEDHPAPAPAAPSLRSVVLTLAITDLAFSLDSIAAAVAVTDRLLIVMAGLRLLVRLGLPQLSPPEWLLLVSVAILLIWGFSVRLTPALAEASTTEADSGS